MSARLAQAGARLVLIHDDPQAAVSDLLPVLGTGEQDKDASVERDEDAGDPVATG
jgi:hypothetical protein